MMNMERKESIQQNLYKTTGRFPVIDQGNSLIAGYTDNESLIYKKNELPIILFGDHTRIFKYIDFPFATGADGTKLFRANDQVVDHRFLYFALLYLDIPSRGYSRHFKYLKEKVIGAPIKLTEQRIVATVLAKIQSAIEVQDKMVATLKELKSSTMAKLFREGLRGEPLKKTEIGEMPESWEVSAINKYCEKPRYGYTASASTKPNGPKFLRITDLTEEGVSWETVPYCSCAQSKLDTLRLKSGDLVFARIGATTGKSFLIVDCPEAVFASYLIRLRTKIGLDPTYLSCFFESEAYWRQVRANKGNNLKGGMNASILSSLIFPVSSLTEQKEIAANLMMINQRIALAVKQRKVLQSLFSSMLHLLMTGQVRVNNLKLKETRNELNAIASS